MSEAPPDSVTVEHLASQAAALTAAITAAKAYTGTWPVMLNLALILEDIWRKAPRVVPSGEVHQVAALATSVTAVTTTLGALPERLATVIATATNTGVDPAGFSALQAMVAELSAQVE
jgi:hypothetical protein